MAALPQRDRGGQTADAATDHQDIEIAHPSSERGVARRDQSVQLIESLENHNWN
jgi:hypothetical protein